MQESKLYGAHFREIDANAPKATKIKFDSDDDEWKIDSTQELFPLVGWFAAAGKFCCPTKMLKAKGEESNLKFFVLDQRSVPIMCFVKDLATKAKLLISVVVQTWFCIYFLLERKYMVLVIIRK